VTWYKILANSNRRKGMPYYHLLKISDEIIKKYFEELTEVEIKRYNKFYKLKLSELSQYHYNVENAKRAVFMRYGENYFTIIDMDTVFEIRNYKWRPGRRQILAHNGELYDKENFYVFTGSNRKLHRFILNPDPYYVVHHNENTFDNRIGNTPNQFQIIAVPKHIHRLIHKYQGNRIDELIVNNEQRLKMLLSYL